MGPFSVDEQSHINVISLALDLTPPLPAALGVLRKWTAESVRFIYLPSSTFIANTKGYPVLPKGTQAFIRESMAASIFHYFLCFSFADQIRT